MNYDESAFHRAVRRERKIMLLKKLSYVCAATLVIVSLAGCGTKGNDNDVNEAKTTDNSSTQTQAPADSNVDVTEKPEVTETPQSNDTSKDVSTLDTSSPDAIIESANALQKKEIDALKSEWESLKGKVDSYKSFVNKEEEIEAFYKKVADKCTAMCTTGYEASLAYAKAINSSGKSFEDKYKDSKNIEEDIYDDLFDGINDSIYEDLFKDMTRSFYEDVLDDQDKSGVDYSTWYDTRSDEYNRWYDTRSDIYNEWYDARSDIYNFYSDLSTEFYSEDQKRVDKVIEKLEKKIEKRK